MRLMWQNLSMEAKSLADYEVLTGGVEDPVTMDKIIVASGDDYDSRYGGNLNLQRRLSDGRSNADLIRCTLCYEARCAHCARVLQFQDFMWADRCRFCDGPMSPQFSRRPWPEQPNIPRLRDRKINRSHEYKMAKWTILM